MKFRVKVYWEMCGEVEVDAINADEAQQKAIDGPLPTQAEYVSDSVNVDAMDVTQVPNPELVHPIIVQEKFDGAVRAGFDAELERLKEVERIAFQTQPGSCPP